MPRRYRLTGCAKLFIFLIIAAPIAYMAASYYNGEDGWKNLKQLVGIESKEKSHEVIPANPELEKHKEMTDARIEQLVRELEELRAENRKLKMELEQLKGNTSDTQ